MVEPHLDRGRAANILGRPRHLISQIHDCAFAATQSVIPAQAGIHLLRIVRYLLASGLGLQS